MVVAGCDVGALTAKAVVMKNDTILGFEIIRTRAKAVQSAADVMDKLLNKLDLSYEDIDYCVSLLMTMSARYHAMGEAPSGLFLP